MVRLRGFAVAAGGVTLATAIFWLARHYVDKGQASLLYLPVVIACAIRFGFGPAVFGAVLSFLCWDFFFLPSYGTFVVDNPKDWLSLIVFLVAALTTAQLAAQGRQQTAQAQARAGEVATLLHASEVVTREVGMTEALTALAEQVEALCGASSCTVFRASADGELRAAGKGGAGEPSALAQAVYAQDQNIGLGPDPRLWTKAWREAAPEAAGEDRGLFLPLHAVAERVGLMHVGPRPDGKPFTESQQQVVLTLANHAATVIARDSLAHEAAAAAALREADALKDSLLSLVSHELRTPLAAIKASASGLLQTGAQWDDAARAEALAAINRESDRLAALVSNLLDLSRLEAGAWVPSKDWCDLGDVIGSVLDRLGPADAARVQLQMPADLPLIRADEAQIALVLENLLQNAAKYAPGDNPIVVDACVQDQGILLRVRDYGAGLAPGEEEKILTRFYRGARHRDGLIHGTGLGLALCQAVVRAHGGRLWAANAPVNQPRGAVFSLILPLE